MVKKSREKILAVFPGGIPKLSVSRPVSLICSKKSRQKLEVDGETEAERSGGLYVRGLPPWALQFQIALAALKVGNSVRAMGAMEEAFLCYETWLPR